MPAAATEDPPLSGLSDDQLLEAAGAGPKFETPLSPTEEKQFTGWKQAVAPNDSGFDYDFRGAFKAGTAPDNNGHWPDTFKKPVHPTFSDQSIYASARPDLAGSWEGDRYVSAQEKQLRGVSDDELAAIAVKQGLLQPDEAAAAVQHKKQADRAPIADAAAEAAGPAANIPAPLAKLLLTGGGRPGDIAAQVLTPIIGGIVGTAAEPGVGTIAGGAAGGALGDTLAQAREYFRGERDTFGKGEVAVNTVLGGLPIGGALLKTPARVIATRAAQGGLLGAAGETARQAIDEHRLDFKGILAAGGLGALFGAGAGGVEAMAARRAVLKAIRQTPEFRRFDGNDSELVQAVRDRMTPKPEAPVEPRNVTPASPEAPRGPAPTEPVGLREEPPVGTTPTESAGPAPVPASPGPEAALAAGSADIPPGIEGVPGAPAGADYRYTVQRPMDLGNGSMIPGYIQIDEIAGGQNTRSSNLETLRQQGIKLPDVPDHLPTGQYSLDEIQKAARETAPAAAPESVTVPKLAGPEAAETVSKPAHDEVLTAFQALHDHLPAEAQQALELEHGSRWLESPQGQKAFEVGQEAEFLAKKAEELPADDSLRSAMLKQSATLRGQVDQIGTKFAHSFRKEVLARVAAGKPANLPLQEFSDAQLQQAAKLAAPETPATLAGKPEIPETPETPASGRAASPAGKPSKAVKVARGEKVVAPTKAAEYAVSKLAGPKQMKVQKEFLLAAVKMAAKEAATSPTFGADLEALGKAQKWQSSEAATEAFLKKYGDFITFEVPGDGTYRIHNNREALEDFAARIEKQFGRGLRSPLPSNRAIPRLTADELEAYRVRDEEPKTAAMGRSAPRPRASAAAKRVAEAEARLREPAQNAAGLPAKAAELTKTAAEATPAKWFKGVRSVFAPQTLDAGAERMALILRAAFGREYQALEQADASLQSFRAEFDRTPVARTWIYKADEPLPRNYDVMAKIDTGNREGLTPAEKSFAAAMDAEFHKAIEAVQEVSPNSLRELLANYMPRIWRDPDKNANLLQVLATHQPLEGPKSFLRKRVLEYFSDGIKIGLQPMSDNPVDLTLQKLGEMYRFTIARKAMAEAKRAGLRKFKYVYEQMPLGWRSVDDPSSDVWKPPTVTIQEAFDAQLRTKTYEMLRDLGIPHQRLTSLGASERWGDANSQAGIRTKFGGPDFIFWHEAGHMLDWRYPELRKLVSAESTARTPGTPGAQMRALADLRWEGENRLSKGFWVSWKEGDKRRSKFFRDEQDAKDHAGEVDGTVRPGQQADHYVKYVRKTEEKIANMFDAYIRAPEKFRGVAPDIWKAFNDWLDKHPEVRRPLDEIRPSLKLGSKTAEMFVGGPIKLGDWVMPEGAAQVLDNYLQPGLGRFAAFRGLRDLSGLANGVQLLGFFHGQFVMNDSFYSGIGLALYDALQGRPARAMRELVQIPVSPFTSWFRGRQMQAAIRQPSTATEMSRKLGQLAVEANLRAGSGIGDGQLSRQWGRALRELRASPNTGAAWETFWRTPLAAVETALSPIMRHLVPAMKLGIFARMAERVIADNPTASLPQLRKQLAMAADATEDRLGQVTYNNLFQNRVLKDLAQLALRAYGWQLTKYRMMAGGAADWGAAARDAASGKKPTVSFRMAYLPAMLIGHAIIAATIQYMLTGKPPAHPVDYLFPDTGLKDKLGRPVRVSVADFVKDAAADWHSFPNVNKMGAEWTHKLAPFWNMSAEMYQNRDFWGTEIFQQRQPGEPELEHLLTNLGDGAKYLGSTAQPFSLRAGQKFADAGAPKFGAYAAPAFGFVPAPRYAIETPMQSYLSDQAGRDSYAKTQAQAEEGRQAREISAVLRDHKPLTADQQTAMRNLSRTQLSNAERRAYMDPDVWAVRGLTLDQGMAAWDLASAAERTKIGPALRLKLGNAFSNRTHDAATLQRYLHVLNQP